MLYIIILLGLSFVIWVIYRSSLSRRNINDYGVIERFLGSVIYNLQQSYDGYTVLFVNDGRYKAQFRKGEDLITIDFIYMPNYIQTNLIAETLQGRFRDNWRTPYDKFQVFSDLHSILNPEID